MLPWPQHHQAPNEWQRPQALPYYTFGSNATVPVHRRMTINIQSSTKNEQQRITIEW
jgi:hypothetical protein